MRLFIGVPLADTTADSLAATAQQLRAIAGPDGLRWSARESWHITLQFLGTTKPEQYNCLTARLRGVYSSPIVIELGSVGIFDRAGVLFVDVRVTAALTSLQQAVLTTTTPCGFRPEDRPYHPHITLARAKGKAGGRELRTLKSQARQHPNFVGFTADSFLLYESIPTPEGSRYEVRERFPLHA
jgi:RNA 2',3'-cyclic 3'-phosphodiesterase